MRQARTKNTIHFNAPPPRKMTPPPIPPRPKPILLIPSADKPLPSPPSSPESELCQCDLCPVTTMPARASLSPSTSRSSRSSSLTSWRTPPNSSPITASDLLPPPMASARGSTTSAPARASKPKPRLADYSVPKRRIRAKGHLTPSPTSNDVVLDLYDLPAWTIGYPPDRRVKEALRLSLSCGGIEVDSEDDIDTLRHDTGLDFGEDPRLADLVWGKGCHFTFNFWPRLSSRPSVSSRPSLGSSPVSPVKDSSVDAEREERERQARIARQNDPVHIRKTRLLKRLNPLRQTENFNALTIKNRIGQPDGFGGVYSHEDLEYIQDKLLRHAPLELRESAWYRDGVLGLGLDPDVRPDRRQGGLTV